MEKLDKEKLLMWITKMEQTECDNPQQFDAGMQSALRMVRHHIEKREFDVR